jgi:hypothetical protein
MLVSDKIMRKHQATRDRDLQFRDLQSGAMQSRAAQQPGLQLGAPAIPWRRIATSRRLTLFFWVYISQAVAGSVAGFIVPFLYYFGVL